MRQRAQRIQARLVSFFEQELPRRLSPLGMRRHFPVARRFCKREQSERLRCLLTLSVSCVKWHAPLVLWGHANQVHPERMLSPPAVLKSAPTAVTLLIDNRAGRTRSWWADTKYDIRDF